jgi:hypothetical protein
MAESALSAEYVIRRYPDWQCRYEVLCGRRFVGLAFSRWTARRLIAKDRQRQAREKTFDRTVVYREPV